MACASLWFRCHKMANLRFVPKKRYGTQEIDDINLPTKFTRCCGISTAFTGKKCEQEKFVGFLLPLTQARHSQSIGIDGRTAISMHATIRQQHRMPMGTASRQNTYTTDANLALSITVCSSAIFSLPTSLRVFFYRDTFTRHTVSDAAASFVWLVITFRRTAGQIGHKIFIDILKQSVSQRASKQIINF